MSNALAAIAPPALPAIVHAEMDAARGFALAEKSPATRRAYRSDFLGFTAWCNTRGLVALPASSDTVAAFLAALATGGAKASTIGRKAAAVRYAHKLAGHEPPTGVEVVKAVMRGIRREIGTAKAQKAPATADRIADMVRTIPDTLTGKRDRALLLLSRDSWLGQRNGHPLAVQVVDCLVNGTIEVGDARECLMSQVVRLQVVPDDLDVVEFRGVFR